MINYAVVIVTYNRVNYLKKEIESLFNQKVRPKKIVIVDNCSSDGTEDYINTLLKFANNQVITYERMNKNLGGSYGFYEGIKIAMQYSDIDWIALGDDDVRYTHDFFESISSSSKAYKDILCFTGSVKYENNTIQLDHRRTIKNFITLKQTNISESQYKNNFYIDIFSFVGVVINKKVIEDIGLPIKDYFIWCDDTEYALRVRRCTKILNVSSAIIYHDTVNSKNTKFSLNWKTYYGKRNNILMTRKHSEKKIIYLLLIPLMFIKDISAVLFKYNYYSPYIKNIIFIYYCAYRDGIKGKTGTNENFMP